MLNAITCIKHGEVVNVDVNNYIATFKLKSDKKMNVME